MTEKQIDYIVVKYPLKIGKVFFKCGVKFLGSNGVVRKNSKEYVALKKLREFKGKMREFPIIELYRHLRLKPKEVLMHFGKNVYKIYCEEYIKEINRVKEEKKNKIVETTPEIKENINGGLCIQVKKDGSFCKGRRKSDELYCAIHLKHNS